MCSDGLHSTGIHEPDNIKKEKSELFSPRVGYRKRDIRDSRHYRETTFEDLFRERFVPLDCKKKVGNYVIGKTIGEGSFCKVRYAKHAISGDKCAIKILPKKSELLHSDVKRRFLREVRSLRQITHNHVVRLVEVMETSRNYYIVLELLSGTNFKDFLKKRVTLSEEEARLYMTQMADALNYMHTHSVVHRDLKPENVLLQGDQIKIIDFGLSASLLSSATMTTQCGSPAYAAPEIFNKQPYTQVVDVWSAGVILYLALTGGLPFSTHGYSSAHQFSSVPQGYTLPQEICLSNVFSACATLHHFFISGLDAKGSCIFLKYNSLLASAIHIIGSVTLILVTVIVTSTYLLIYRRLKHNRRKRAFGLLSAPILPTEAKLRQALISSNKITNQVPDSTKDGLKLTIMNNSKVYTIGTRVTSRRERSDLTSAVASSSSKDIHPTQDPTTEHVHVADTDRMRIQENIELKTVYVKGTSNINSGCVAVTPQIRMLMTTRAMAASSALYLICSMVPSMASAAWTSVISINSKNQLVTYLFLTQLYCINLCANPYVYIALSLGLE